HLRLARNIVGAVLDGGRSRGSCATLPAAPHRARGHARRAEVLGEVLHRREPPDAGPAIQPERSRALLLGASENPRILRDVAAQPRGAIAKGYVATGLARPVPAAPA